MCSGQQIKIDEFVAAVVYERNWYYLAKCVILTIKDDNEVDISFEVHKLQCQSHCIPNKSCLILSEVLCVVLMLLFYTEFSSPFLKLVNDTKKK